MSTEQDAVYVEGFEFAAAEPADRFGYVREEFGELRFVVGRYRLTCLPTIRFLGHELRLV